VSNCRKVIFATNARQSPFASSSVINLFKFFFAEPQRDKLGHRQPLNAQLQQVLKSILWNIKN